MTSTRSATTIERKMAAAREGARAGGRSAPAALRLGMARAARDVLSLPLVVTDVDQKRLTRDALAGHLRDEDLLMLLDGPKRALGVLSADRDTVTALIQQQTMGRVAPGAPSERPFTGTDAALMQPLVNAMIERAAALAEIAADRAGLAGFRFGARSADVRSLILALEAERFRVFDLRLDYGDGVRQGGMCLALPEADTISDGRAKKAARARMERALGPARAELTTLIGSIRMPLSELSAMRPGDLLPLTGNNLAQAELIAIDGSKVAAARLGQAGGFRAVRLRPPGQASAEHGPAEGFDTAPLPAPSAAMAPAGAGGPPMPLPDLPMPDLPMPGEAFPAMAQPAPDFPLSPSAPGEETAAMPLPALGADGPDGDMPQFAGLPMPAGAEPPGTEALSAENQEEEAG